MEPNNRALTTQFMPETLDEKLKLAEIFVKSGILPESIDTKEKLVMIWYAAQELAIEPFAAINHLFPIKGKVTMSADMMKAKIYNHPDFVDFQLTDNGQEGEAFTKTCTIVRKINGKNITFTNSFSIRQAFLAGLLGKDNWKNYSSRMLGHRVVSFTARDAFPDVIMGLYTPDEAATNTIELPENEVEILEDKVEDKVEKVTEPAVEEKKSPRSGVRVIKRTAAAPPPPIEPIEGDKPEGVEKAKHTDAEPVKEEIVEDPDQITLTEAIEKAATEEPSKNTKSSAKAPEKTKKEPEPAVVGPDKARAEEITRRDKLSNIALDQIDYLRANKAFGSSVQDQLQGLVTAAYDHDTYEGLKKVCEQVLRFYRVARLFVNKAIDGSQASSFKNRLLSFDDEKIGNIDAEIAKLEVQNKLLITGAEDE